MATPHAEPGEQVRLEDAADALRRAVAAPVRDRERWREGVRDALARFETAMEQHAEATQSRDGTFEAALEASLGRVRAEIDRLTRDHVRLWSQVRFLSERVDEGAGDLTADVDALAAQVAEHTSNVARLSERHHQALE